MDKLFQFNHLNKSHDKQKQKEKKMSKIKTRTQENNFSVLQILGSLFLIFAVADFALSWMGVNLTPFMGTASRFSPIIFGMIGSVLLNMKKEDG